MKHKLITITALAAALSTLASCRQEEAPSGLNGPLDISLEIAESPLTKVDVDGNSGACTWSSGDQIGICVTDSNGSSYQPVTVNTTSNTVHLSLTPEKSITPGYSVTPYYMADGSDTGKTGSTPKVHYKNTYSMSGRDLTQQAFSMVPMMAVSNDELLRFYHTGALLRLVMANVPDGTVKITVTFQGMTNVTGTCTVTNPGTYKATTAIAVGEGNVVTFTDVTRSASTMYLNVPLPTINYNTLSAIRVECLGSTNNSLGIVTKSIPSSWGTLKHGYGRSISVDFGAALLSGVRLSSTADVTLWKSKEVTRTAVALDPDGLPDNGATITWRSSEPSVATVSSTTGRVIAVAPGETDIYATATLGETVKEASYKVYVNAVTSVSLTAQKSTIYAGETDVITANITHTGNGTVQSFPSNMVSWSTNSYLSLASSPAQPSAIDNDTAYAQAVVKGGNDGAATVTASISSSYTTSSVSNTVPVTVDYITTISGGDGTMGGLYLSRGWIVKLNGSTELSHSALSDPIDPFEMIKYYNANNSEATPYKGSTSGLRHYFSFEELGNYFSGYGLNGYSFTTSSNINIPTTTSSKKILYNGDYWYLASSANWTTILSNSRVGATVNGESGKLWARVLVNLTGTSYAGKGLSTNSTTSSITSSSGTNYIAGIIIFPDNAVIQTTANLKNFEASKSYFTNSMDAEAIITLCDGPNGCVFIPCAGYSYKSGYQRWTGGGTTVMIVTATHGTTSNMWGRMQIEGTYNATLMVGQTNFEYAPCLAKLIRDDN